MSLRTALCCFGLVVTSALPLPAADEPLRQFYSGWKTAGNQAYSFRVLNYKLRPADAGYAQQYLIYYAQRPDYLYLYNPQTGKYWGRYARKLTDGNRFSLLDGADQKPLLGEILEPAFSQLGPAPALPGTVDQVPLLSPATAAGKTEVIAAAPVANLPAVEKLAAAPGSKPAGIVRVPNPPRVMMRQLPPQKPKPKYAWVTVNEPRWVEQYTYTTVIRNGTPIWVGVPSGYWTQVPVRKRVLIPPDQY